MCLIQCVFRFWLQWYALLSIEDPLPDEGTAYLRLLHYYRSLAIHCDILGRDDIDCEGL